MKREAGLMEAHGERPRLTGNAVAVRPLRIGSKYMGFNNEELSMMK
jgi:hypothetical protein